MSQLRYILFDADNTLFDFDASEHLAFQAVLADFAIPYTPEREAGYVAHNRALWAAFDRGEISREALVVERFDHFLKANGLPGDPAEINRQFLRRLGEQSILLPGAQALCHTLAQRYTLAIITNGVSIAQRGRFSRSPIRDDISHLFISEEVGFQKPERAFFDTVCAALGITQPGEAVVVGDSLSADIQGAVNAAIPSIWYNPKGLPMPETPQPTWQVCSFQELTELLCGAMNHMTKETRNL